MQNVKPDIIGKVYTLSCKDGNVFYVGCTILELSLRLRQHISEVYALQRDPNSIYYNKLKANKIISLDFDIYATIVETIVVKKGLNGKDALKKSEHKWIEKFRIDGCDLVNGGHNRNKTKEQVQKVGLKISAKELNVKKRVVKYSTYNLKATA